VLETNATISPESVSNILKNDPKIGAVLAVHLYGHTSDMETLTGICKEHNVMLIEDLAQAMGGVYKDGKPFGSSGDCSIVSFSYSKIIDIGGGGALLTDDDALAKEARLAIKEFNEQSDDFSFQDKIYRELFYDFWKRSIKDDKDQNLFDIFPSLFRDVHTCKISEEHTIKIINSLKDLDEVVAKRKRIYELYREEFSGIPDVKLFSPKGGYSPWRFTFRVPKDIRSSLLEQVRRKGFDISCWYPCIARWTPSGREQDLESFKVALVLEKEVVNLWVNSEYGEQKALELSKVIKQSLGDLCLRRS